MDKIIPTADSKVAEIKAYLDSEGIEYQPGMTKSELLDLIPTVTEDATVEPEPIEEVPEPIVPSEPRFTKAELIEMTSHRQKVWFITALDDAVLYTWQEALDAVLECKKGMFS